MSHPAVAGLPGTALEGPARSAHPMPAGRMGPRVALLSLAIGVAAVNTGNNLLYLMLSLSLALAAISTVASRRALRSLRVTAHLPEEVRSGEPFVVSAEVEGSFPLLPQTWVSVMLDGLPGPVEISVPVTLGSRRGVGTRSLTMSRRGIYDDLAISAATGYPLDLWLYRVDLGRQRRLVVLPRHDRLSYLRAGGTAGGFRDPIDRPSGRPGPAGQELHQLREYTPSDDARRIEWRSTARRGRLMVRELEAQQERLVDMVLDLEADSPEAFEQVVERCASILDLSIRQGFEARLIVAGREPLTGWAAMRTLAAVTPEPTGRSAGGFRDALSRARRGAELIVLSADPDRQTPIEVR